MYSDFLLRNNLFDLLENRGEYNKQDVNTLEVSLKNPKITQNEFDKTLQKLFPFEKNHRIFSSYKNLDRPPFNDSYSVSRGLHPFRRYFSQIAHEKRNGGNKTYDKVGLIVKEKFAPARMLRAAREEFDIFPSFVNKQPQNILSANKDVSPTLNKISKDIYQHILDCIGSETDEIKDKYLQNTFAQKVHNRPGDNDHQKLAHVDTFFPAIKWWWFPEEVKLEHGPFCYAKGSCYPTDTYLDWIFNESLNIIEDEYELWKGKDHTEGSFRASEEELIAMQFELEPVPVKANTLVIANVSGFHSRGEVTTEYVRNAIHGSIRIDNPFQIS